MKRTVLVGVMVGVLASGVAAAQAAAQPAPGATSLGSITLTRKVMANGEALAPGTYQLRLTTEAPQPTPKGQSADAARWVEFVQRGTIKAREVVTIVSDTDLPQIQEKGPRPARGGRRIDVLKGNQYVRVWINRDGQNYLLHLPVGS